MNDIKDLKGQVQQLQNEKIEMAGHHVDFQNARAARTLELEVQVKCINTHQADREDRPEAEREQYKLQIQRLESAREDRNNVIHSLNNHAAGLRSENTALTRENQESKSQCQKLDAKVTELQENNSKLEKLVADLRDKNETLEASNENLRTENQQLRAANRDLSRQVEEFDAAQDEAHAEIERFGSRAQRCEDLLARRQDELKGEDLKQEELKQEDSNERKRRMEDEMVSRPQSKRIKME
jgi:chromosome segregation ATPase